MTATLAAPSAGPTRTATRAGWLLGALLTGQFMAMVDVAIVNIAAPTIGTELRASGAQLQLIVAGYTIAYAVLLITGARVGARFGHRATFLWGLAGFTAASLACGLAANAGQLIAFRFVQGAGAALMVPQIFSIVQRTFEGPARARAVSLYAAAIAAGSTVGQIGGGLLLSADLFGTGWRPAFLVNVPIGLVLLAAARRLVPVDRGDRAGGLDLPGLALLTPAVLLFVGPVVLGHERGWPWWCWLSLGLSAVAFAGFVRVQRWVQGRGRVPLVPGRILRIGSVCAAGVVLFTAFVFYGGWLFSLTVYVQSGLGHAPLPAALIFLPSGVAFAAVSLTWRRLPPAWHRRVIPLGLGSASVACALVGLVGGASGPAGPHPVLLATLVGVAATGLAFSFSPVIAVALAEVPPADAAHASGLLTTVMQLSQAIGVATFGTLYLVLAPVTTAIRGTTAALATTELTAAVLALFLLTRRHRPRRS